MTAKCDLTNRPLIATFADDLQRKSSTVMVHVVLRGLVRLAQPIFLSRIAAIWYDSRFASAAAVTPSGSGHNTVRQRGRRGENV